MAAIVPEGSACRGGVIFDMDGVLVDSYQPHFESWRALAAEIGREFTEPQFAATFGRTSREIIATLFDIHDEESVRRCDDRKESLYRDLIRRNVPAMPGAIELAAELHSAGFRLAIGSSGPPENIELVCRSLGLDRWFMAVVTGADVTRGKPDPEVFLIAARRIDLPPARCVVIEDAPAGLAAARSAGMKCIGLTSSHGPATLEADVVVGELSRVDAGTIDRLLSI